MRPTPIAKRPRRRRAAGLPHAHAARAPEPFKAFWALWWADLWTNARYAWPVPVALLGWVLLSGWGLLAAERGAGPAAPIRDYGDAVFCTFMALFGENIGPQSLGGRVIFVVDALLGLLLLGFVVWVFTFAAERAEDACTLAPPSDA